MAACLGETAHRPRHALRHCGPRVNRLLIATHNAGKRREFAALLGPLGFEVVSSADLGLAEPDETATSFAGNAQLKARVAAKAAGIAALADDSGLCVTALNGGP